jgi:NAD+ diphosphatase
MNAHQIVTFGHPALDRAAHLRRTIDDIISVQNTKAVLNWRGKPLITKGDAPKLARLSLDHPLARAASPDGLFLGLDGETHIMALDISHWQAPDIDETAMLQFFDSSENHHPDADKEDWFVELRGIMAQLSPEDANIAATTRALWSWHNAHPYCAKCGEKTQMSDGGWRRDCPSCNSQHFPRTDAVVIMLVTHNNSVLLGRSHNWPEGMYSLLAGFVEPGETIETATKREVFEETGVTLGDVRYVASQPWPFPTSLMFGTAAEATSTQITLDPNELDDAKWVRREDVLAAMSGDSHDLKPARQGSIARFLLEKWVRDDID